MSQPKTFFSLFKALNQGSQTRGPHVARKGLLCGPWRFLDILKKLTFTFPSALKKTPRNNWIKPEWHPVRFSSRPQHYRPNFTPREIFAKSWEYAKDVYIRFVDLDKADDRFPREKRARVFQLHASSKMLRVQCWQRLLLAVKSLYSCSEVCVHLGKVKSPPFTVGVGLRKGVCCHHSFS